MSLNLQIYNNFYNNYYLDDFFDNDANNFTYNNQTYV